MVSDFKMTYAELNKTKEAKIHKTGFKQFRFSKGQYEGMSSFVKLAGLFCDGTRRYGVPAPFSKARNFLIFMCK